jgi:hypothetical protein
MERDQLGSRQAQVVTSGLGAPVTRAARTASPAAPHRSATVARLAARNAQRIGVGPDQHAADATSPRQFLSRETGLGDREDRLGVPAKVPLDLLPAALTRMDARLVAVGSNDLRDALTRDPVASAEFLKRVVLPEVGIALGKPRDLLSNRESTARHRPMMSDLTR